MKKWTLLTFILAVLICIKPADYQAAENLQAQIDAMKEGAVLKLDNHTYQGSLVINKSVTIIGGSHTVIKGDGTGNVISINAPHVTLKNLIVTGSSFDRNSSEEYAGIKIYSNHNTIENLIIRHSFHGIYLSKAQFNTIRDNDIKGLGKGQIASQGNGIHVYYAKNNLLSGNTIDSTRDGMFFDYANHNKSIKNTISNTRYGLHYMYSDDNLFKQNVFTMNTGGAAIMNSNHLKLEDNQFIINYGNQSFGLLLLQANDNHIQHNTFYMNQRGLYIDQATNNRFMDNQIIKNQIGVELWASSNDEVFSANKIHDNTIPAVTLGGQGENNVWSDHGKGNDWGPDFPLTDLNQDGIGDFAITYRSSLHQLLEDQELTSFFLKSPAISIYEKINAALNKDDVMFHDAHPLLSAKRNNTIAILITVLLAAVVMIKGGKRLCLTFGRNGKKQ